MLLIYCGFTSTSVIHQNGQFYMTTGAWTDGPTKTPTTTPTTTPPFTSAPNMRSCSGPDNECECHFTGNWNIAEEYEQLKLLTRRADRLTDDITLLDIGLLKDTMNTIQERMLTLKERIYNQTVSITVRGLFDIQRSVNIMKDLIDHLDLNYTSPEVIALLQDELKNLDDIIDDLWSSHPTPDLTNLANKIKELEARLSNCHENYNISYFRGDSLPIKLENDHWCEDLEFAGVGGAVAHSFESHSQWTKGNFMKDPYPQTDTNRSMILVRNYIGSGSYTINYNRYKNYSDFIGSKNAEVILSKQTKGDGYTLYKGAIYDHDRNNKLNRFLVNSGSSSSVSFVPSYINYFKQESDTYADLKADETGLYVIYTESSTNGDKLVIGQLDPTDLNIKKIWRTSRHKASVCAAFMVCGKLYTIDNCWSRVPPSNSNKQYIFDTLTGEETHIPLHIPSKFGQIRQLSYNSRERVLFGWDNGHMITYPIIWKPKASN